MPFTTTLSSPDASRAQTVYLAIGRRESRGVPLLAAPVSIYDVRDLERLVRSAGEPHVLGLRLVTVGSPNWRARAVSMLKPIDVKSPGVEGWLLSRENAAMLYEELKARSDVREHSAPQVQIVAGQSRTLARTQPVRYQRGVQPRPDGLGYELIPGQIDEGYSLRISPLLSLDRQAVERLPDERGGLLARQQSIGQHISLGFDVSELLQVLVERNLARAMTAPPPPLTVPGLIDDDAIDPGAEGGLPAETGQRPEDAQEYFLRKVQRFVGVSQQVQCQRVDHPLVRVDEVGAGGFVTGRAAFDEGGFRRVDVGPTDSASVLHQPSGNNTRLHQSSTVL